MAAKDRGVTYAISTEAAEKSFTGFLDMLRYDNARVSESDGRLIVLVTVNNIPAEGRWASFRIPVLASQTWGPRTYADIPTLRQDALARLP